MNEKRDPIGHLVETIEAYKAAVGMARLVWCGHRLHLWDRSDGDTPAVRAYRQAVAGVDRTHAEMVAAMDAAVGRIRESGGDPAAVYRLAELSDFVALTREWKQVRPMLRACMSTAGDTPPNRPPLGSGPTRTEIDTYKVYVAVERHLMREGDQSRVLQSHIHDAAKSLLDSVISRDEIGVGEDYEIPTRFEAFIRAFRRGRDGLAR